MACSMKHTTADTPNYQTVVAEQPDVRHEDAGVDVDSMERVEM